MAERVKEIAQPSDLASRRTFLCGTLAAAGWACAPRGATRGDSSTPAGAKSTPVLGVALLGLGNYAEQQLAPSLRSTRHCTLRGIVTGSPEKVERWQRAYQVPDRNVYSYETLRSIADNPAIDVVYIVVPTALHAKYAIQAAEAGKHVWCEKPMAMTATECQTIIDACNANRVSLSIGYRMQHEPNTQTVMRLARERPYGPIQGIRALAGDRSEGDTGWRLQRSMGGGSLYDMGVYCINALRYASGEEPTRVLRARQWSERTELYREVDECTEFELALPSGAKAYGKSSRADSENRLRVDAQRGWYMLEPMQAYRGVAGRTSDGQALDQKIDRQQTRQMDDDALAILERRRPMVPGEEGQRDIRILEAIIAAAQRGAEIAL